MRPWVIGLVLFGLAGCAKKAPPQAAAEIEAEAAPAFDPNAPLHVNVALAIDKLASGTAEDLDLAVTILESCLPRDPGGATELNLAIALQRRGAVPAAVTHYEAVRRAHPDWHDVWVYLGSAKERLGDVDGAIALYREAIGVDGENIGARVALIAALRTKGQPDDAIEEAKAALKVNSNSLPVYNNFALAYLDKGDTTLARFILQKALQGVEGAQTNAYLHTNLGWSHYVDGNKPAAVQSLQQAVELEPELVPALVYLATVYLEDRNYADMIPLLETARAKDPDNADVHLNLGIAYRGMQRFDEARQAYATALELEPGNPDPWFNLGILLGDSLKHYEPSVEAFDKYLEGGGSDTERAEAYIAAVDKERETAERRRKAEERRKAREAERQREQELLKKAQEEAAASPEPAESGSDASASPAPEVPADPSGEEPSAPADPIDEPEAAEGETP